MTERGSLLAEFDALRVRRETYVPSEEDAGCREYETAYAALRDRLAEADAVTQLIKDRRTSD